VSEIEWTGITWTCITGCSDASTGCLNCYARLMSWRLHNMGQWEKYPADLTRRPGGILKWTGRILCHQHMLDVPLRWRRPQLVFVNSMSDTFHEKVPEEFIQHMFAVMLATPQHTYQVLTKRADRLVEMAPRLPWPKNVWMGISVENPDYLWRLDCLRRVPAYRRFGSVEPLLAPLPTLDLTGIHWVIVGGESGPGARPMHVEWVRSIRDRCVIYGCPLFFKQYGCWKNNPTPRDQELADPKTKGGATLDGRLWHEMPERWEP
jgi:protein gp37